MDLRATCPTDVAGMLRAAADASVLARWGAAHVSLCGGGPPWVPPIQQLLRRKTTEAWTTRHCGVVRGVALRGHHTQRRLVELRMAEDDTCRACGLAPGTGGHRIRDCPAPWIVEGRRRCAGAAQLRVEQGVGSPLWERGLVAAPMTRGGSGAPPRAR